MAAKTPLVRPSRRPAALRALMAVAVVLVLAGTLHGLTWRWMGTQLEAGFRVWAQLRRDHGWRVHHDPPVRGGWPFLVTLTVPALRVATGPAPEQEGVEWTSSSLVLRIAPPFFDRLTADASRPQRLRIGGLDIPFAADRLDISLPFEPGAAVRQAELVAERLRIGTAEGSLDVDALRLRIEARGS
ncbi:MAG TPA: DUF2125 domain-containing protein, partial [Acetobacteraceae bacterium]|nr:DUF2125 domain-containing protein [Acetobacteraceae bacterium]